MVGCTLAAPIQAASPLEQSINVRAGAFVGARFQLSLGGHERARPRAELAIAPTSSRSSNDGLVRTRIGDGLALNLSPSSKPTVTLAGVRADIAFNLQPRGQTNSEMKMGISTGGWVAIGVGVAALIGGAYFLHLVDEADKHSD
jgi:hypothetical protein